MSKILQVLLLINLLLLATDCLSSKCKVKIEDVCVKYDKEVTVTQSYCWYDSRVLKDCVLLSQNCVLPNHNFTFPSIKKCLQTCQAEETSTTEKDSSPNKDCETESGKCDKDLAPTSQSSLHVVSLVVSITCSVAVVGILVATAIVATMYRLRQKRVKREQHRKQIQDMLNTLTDPHGDDDLSDDSFDAEENNLFDRLEESFW